MMGVSGRCKGVYANEGLDFYLNECYFCISSVMVLMRR